MKIGDNAKRISGTTLGTSCKNGNIIPDVLETA